MGIQELKTLHHICELERTQLLTISGRSAQSPQLSGGLLTGTSKNFLFVEGHTTWLCDCPQFLSPLCEADTCVDRIPINYQDTVVYFVPITRQTSEYETPISCDNNQQKVIALDLDSDEPYVLTLKPVLRATPMLFGPKQTQPAIRPKTFTAQETRNYSNAGLANFLESCLNH